MTMPTIPFTSTFDPGPRIEAYLRDGRITDPDETAATMVERVVAALSAPEHGSRAGLFAAALGTALDRGQIVFSTPIMTNAGRRTDRPLAACAVPPVDLQGDLAHVKSTVDDYHRAGMGTGFNLARTGDPVAVLRFLNDIAVAGASGGTEDRPVGNMAVLPLDHPAADAFLACKTGVDEHGEQWKFNISLLVTDAQMRSPAGSRAHTLIGAAARAAHRCADPGLLFIDRMNETNPTPHIGEYVSTAPCAEVGLVAGETCQFGYVNLAAFHRPADDGLCLDLDGLAGAVRLLVRALDNAIDVSLDRYPHALSTQVMRAKRRIGVGVCGLADLLLAAGLPYASPAARRLAQEAIGHVNHVSKIASVELARERGACPAVGGRRSRYADPSFLARFDALGLRSVPDGAWRELAVQVARTGLLRNASTVALPPTGRSAAVVGASTGIEPLFTLLRPVTGKLHPAARAALDGDRRLTDAVVRAGKLPDGLTPDASVRALLATATQISAEAHLAMAAAAQTCVDDAVSKTVNVPADTNPDRVEEIFRSAWAMGCKGITVYRDASRSAQPREL